MCEETKHQVLFQVMVMETREQAKSKRAEAHAQDIMEDNKRKIPVIQAKTKLINQGWKNPGFF